MDNKVYKIALAAVMAALIYVATMFFTIPLPGNGYANLGDCFVIIAGFVLGPVYGACAAGIGSALLALALNKTIAGKSYLYPLIPFHPGRLMRHLFRPSLSRSGISKKNP